MPGAWITHALFAYKMHDMKVVACWSAANQAAMLGSDVSMLQQLCHSLCQIAVLA